MLPALMPTQTVWVNDGTSGLGARVLRRLLSSDRAHAAAPADCEVLVWLSAHDADARASRRESALQGLSAALADCPLLTHVVLVSSAMVYGAWANNPVPMYSASQTGCNNVAPGKNCTVTVSFAPPTGTPAGTYSVTLSMTSNASNNPVKVTVNGTVK